MFRTVVLATIVALSLTGERAHAFSITPDFSNCIPCAHASYEYLPFIEEPTYAPGDDRRPIVAVDTTHRNHHTISTGYAPFAALLGEDGVLVEDFSAEFPSGDCDIADENAETCENSRAAYLQALAGIDILVIVNCQESISEDEAAVISGWLSGELACSEGTDCSGRGLFLIADHERFYDFPEKIAALSSKLGLNWPNNNIGTVNDISTCPGPDPTQYGLPARDPEICNANGNIVFQLGGPADASDGRLIEDHPIVLGRGIDEEIRSVKTFFGSGIVSGPGESILTLPSRALWWYDEGKAGETKGNAAGYSQGVALSYQSGRVYASAEAAMFTARSNARGPWGMQVTDDNEQYLLNIIHWLDGILDDTDIDGYPDLEDNCIETANSTQSDDDEDGYGNACDADFNNDGAVGMDDVAALLRGLNTVNPVMDLDEDGVVGLTDLLTTYYALGTVPGPSALVSD
jgi:hypothetical protein